MAVAAVGYVGYLLADSAQREHDITTDQEITECDDVRDTSEFEEKGSPVHGTLSSTFVQDKKTGEKYVKKGAHSREDFVKEYMVSNALHAVDKMQPECLIMQTDLGDGSFQFHTLSRKFDGTQDVEEFVREGRTGELKEKEVVGLESTLIIDQMVGKQSDTKLANMVVRSDDTRLVFTSIDHERAVTPTGLSFFHMTPPQYPTNKTTLIESIKDLGEKSEDNKAGLAGDPRAREFATVAESCMDEAKISAYYASVATANLSPVIAQCHRLAEASRNSLVSESDCTGYEKFFTEMQNQARNTAERAESEKGPLI